MIASRVPSFTLAMAGVALLTPATAPAATASQIRAEPAARRVNPEPAAPRASPGPIVRGLGTEQVMGGVGTEQVMGGVSSGPAARRAHPGRAARRANPEPVAPRADTGPAARRTSTVSAAELLAAVRDCVPVSRGRYRTDHGARATVPVCGTRDAVFWKADMDIDCDGRPGLRCNAGTDPHFSASTAFAQSDGRPLSSERLPYVVVPAPSAVWDYRAHGVRGGSVAAMVYGDRVRYAVVGDTGPADVIGEASYAAAESLGIDPDPRAGGTPSGVTYIVFRDSRVTPVEDHQAAVTTGERLARAFADAG